MKCGWTMNFFAKEMAGCRPMRRVRTRLPRVDQRAGRPRRYPDAENRVPQILCQHGWRVVEEKAEKGVSGSKVSAEKRDVIQFYKALAEQKGNRHFTGISFDRLGPYRKPKRQFVLEWFVKQGVRCGAHARASSELRITQISC